MSFQEKKKYEQIFERIHRSNNWTKILSYILIMIYWYTYVRFKYGNFHYKRPKFIIIRPAKNLTFLQSLSHEILIIFSITF